MITTDISPDIVIHTAVGSTSLSEITATMTAWYRNPAFDPDLPVLWDLREASVQPPAEDLDTWSESNRATINAFRPGRKTAWVLPDPATAEFAVDLLGRSDFQHRVRIFHNDMEAAMSWLTSTIR